MIQKFSNACFDFFYLLYLGPEIVCGLAPVCRPYLSSTYIGISGFMRKGQDIPSFCLENSYLAFKKQRFALSHWPLQPGQAACLWFWKWAGLVLAPFSLWCADASSTAPTPRWDQAHSSHSAEVKRKTCLTLRKNKQLSFPYRFRESNNL